MKTKTITSLVKEARGARDVSALLHSLRGRGFDTRDSRRGAIGWSLMYLVFGGGLVGAVVIYMLVKMIGG